MPTQPEAEALAAQDGDAGIPFVVGIGASAGGLKAFQSLLPGLPADDDVAYVLLQHLDPSHPSMLGSLLQKVASMPVVEIEDGTALQGGRLFICPAHSQCVLDRGRLRLQPLDRSGPRHTIDGLFSSIARDCQERCAGIVLSGTGNDGLQGIGEIKATGGWALAQDPASAEYPAMPQAVIGEFLADFIRPPEAMGRELREVLRLAREDGRRLLPQDGEKLRQLLDLLDRETGFDFQRYKESMLARRLGRRMAANKCGTLAEYLKVIRNSADEPHYLIKDLFITVTGFFRDEKIFQRVEALLREIVERKAPGEEIRVWSAGCATGEEAYTLAMLLARLCSGGARAPLPRVFATDIDAGNIAFARRGLYAEQAVANVPEAMLQRWFEKTREGWQVNSQLREMVVFAEHDVCGDAPFSRLDLLCCRNLLIYFNRETQTRLLERFHYALAPGGCLLLGGSENIGAAPELFEPLSGQSRLYRRAEGRRKSIQAFEPASAARPVLPGRLGAAAAPPPADWQQRMRELYFREYAPAAVLLNRRFETVHLHGRARDWLSLPEGDLRLDVLHLVRPELRSDLRLVLEQARRRGTGARSRPIRVSGAETERLVTLTAIPGAAADGQESSEILLVFEERPAPAAAATGEPDGRLQELQQEVSASRELLRGTTEALDAANQELQSLSEEYQSTTEELQSANEEYQTANEELQSANEELSSVNDELKSRSAELIRANTELDFILDSTLSGIIVIDARMQVIRHSANCRELFGLWPQEARNIHELVRFLRSLPKLGPRLEEALSSGLSFQEELELQERYFMLRLIPVVEPGADAPHSLILTFYDETERRQQQQESQLLAAIVRNSDDAILVHGLDGRILNWNAGAQDMFGYSEDEARRMHMRDLIASDELAAYQQHTESLLAGAENRKLETRALTRNGRALDLWLSASVLLGKDGNASSIAVDLRDITERKVAENRLNALVESTPDPMIIVEADGRIQRLNKQVEALFGYSRKELVGKSFKILVPERFKAQHDVYTREYQKKPLMRQMGKGLELWAVTKSGEEIPVDIGLSPVVAGNETTTLVRFRDVREEREQQRMLAEAKRKADEANRTKSRFLAAASHDLRQPLQSISMYLGALEGELNTEEKKRVLDQAQMALDSTNKLLNALLNITKLESGKVQPEIESFSAGDLLERVYNMEAQQAREKRHRFSLAQSSVQIVSDPALLEQLVTNLVGNAVKYTPAGGHILLGCRRRGDHLLIQVCDNGPGIASKDLDMIFDEYHQLEYQGHYLGKGLGLGLSIVKLVAELLHLRLEVRSTPGKGSTFGVQVPLGLERKTRPKPAKPAARKEEPLSGTVLLIDDDAAVLDSTGLFLELSGFRVLAAAGAAEAFAALERAAPDLIVTDFGLGEDENGIQLVARLRQRLGRQVPAVIITGDTSDHRSQEAKEAGCAIACKPIEAQALLAAVRQQLQGRH